MSHQLRLLRNLRAGEAAPRRPHGLLRARRSPHHHAVPPGPAARAGERGRAARMSARARASSVRPRLRAATRSRSSASTACAAARRRAILERRLRPLAGVEDLTADIVGQRLHVKYDAAMLSTNGIVDAVAETGMRAWLEHEQPVRRRPRRVRAACWWRCPASRSPPAWPCSCSSAAATLVGARRSSLATLAGGVFTGRRALRRSAAATLDINVLMLVAVAGAMLLGEWAEGGDRRVPLRDCAVARSRAAWIARARRFAR